MAKRVLITGGAGFIGSHLVRRLLDRGDDVHALVRPTTSLHRLADVIDAVHVHRIRLSDEQLADCLAEIAPDHVYHLAVETRQTSRPDFVAATLSVREDLMNLIALLAALAELQPPPAIFVRAGSIAEYGAAPVPYHEDHKEWPDTPYGAGLAAGTTYLSALEGALPFPVVTARLALVFGPGQSEAFMVPALVRACLDGESFHITHPSHRRDLIYIDDVVDALLLLAGKERSACTIINIATGIAPTIRDVAGLVIEATGADPALVTFSDPAQEGGFSELRSSVERARALLGWTAETSMRDGIVRTVAAMTPLQAKTAQRTM